MRAVDQSGDATVFPGRAAAFGSAEALTILADPIPAAAPLHEAIKLFRDFPDARYLAVVDERRRPLGAVHERTVRDLLFSPFGHALLANPGCRWILRDMMRPCAVAEQGLAVDELVAAFGDAPDAEGLILTRGGRYAGLLPGQALLRLAAERARAAQRRQRGEAEAAIERSRALERAFTAFRADAVEFGAALGVAAAEIHASASAVAERAARNGDQALMVASASTQSSDSIAEISASSAELATQCRRIEDRTAQALLAFERTVGHVQHGVAKARGLSAAADAIGTVVSLITAIAAKVNMLAINATIEAARAGPAGRSFAVVAGEVKLLAGQTGQAARQIEAQIEAVRAAIADNSASNQAVEAIVRNLGDICSDISGSVGEQSAATRMIAANVEQAAQGSARVAVHVGEIGERAAAAGEMAVRLGGVAEALGARAGQLRDRVETFLGEIRAA